MTPGDMAIGECLRGHIQGLIFGLLSVTLGVRNGSDITG